MELILKYFPDLSPVQIEQFAKLDGLYKDWNVKINVVSRKDIDELYLRHVLHSLAIAKVINLICHNMCLLSFCSSMQAL